MKLVHAADLHLDSPLRGLLRYPGAPVERMRTATRRALENLVDLCIAEHAGLLLLAGDLYDGDWRDFSTGLFFHEQMLRLRDAGVKVVSIRGNHDAASQITARLRLPDNVRELAFRSAETVTYEELGVAVHGQSFATRAVTENLAASYPQRLPQLLNVGLLHTSVTGRSGHEPYAPCSLATLQSKGYDYWALGHVHAREVLCEDPWVVFPGNLQGRHARELGDKGATVVEYDAGGVRSVVHKAVDVVRYCACTLDVSTAVSLDDVIDSARAALAAELERADGRTLAARFVLIGATDAHTTLHTKQDALLADLRASAMELASDQLWIEKLIVRTHPRIDLAALRQGESAFAELLAAIERLRGDDDALTALAKSLPDLPKLPSEVTEGEDGTRCDDPRFLRAQLDAVEQLLIEQLAPHRPGP